MSTAGNDDNTAGKPDAPLAGPTAGDAGSQAAEPARAIDEGEGWSEVAASGELPARSTAPSAPLPAPLQTSASATLPTASPRPLDKPKAPPELPPAPPEKSSSGGGGMSKRAAIVLIALAVLAATVAALWIAGSQNSHNYYLRCGADAMQAERGDSFPPWGEEPLRGPAWEPIEFIVPTPQCDDEAFTDRDALEAAYRRALLAQAERWLSGLRPKDPREHLDTVQKQLEQALLLSRSSDDPSVAARERVGHLLGDIEYWRAHDQLAAARKELDAAAERFAAAVDRNPVHVRTANSWLEFVRQLAQELDAGPPALRAEQPGQPGRAAQPSPGSGVGTPEQPVRPSMPGGEPANEPGSEPANEPGDAAPDAPPGQFVPPEADTPPAPAPVPTPGSGTLL